MRIRLSIKLSSLRRGVGLTLCLAGAAFLTVSLAGYAQGTVWQRSQKLDALPPPGDETLLQDMSERAVGSLAEAAPPVTLTEGDPFARLAIPKIDLDLTVIEGTREEDLLKAPGHLAGSAVPGAVDNCIIAGHRDRHFRHLGELASGDVIRLEREGMVAEYLVESGQIVNPDRTDLLAPSQDGILTLITCYPFYYVGPAPKRYVVRAVLQRVDRESL